MSSEEDFIAGGLYVFRPDGPSIHASCIIRLVQGKGLAAAVR